MFELRCAVRRCEAPLMLDADGLSCAAGHHFDRAKSGYWSLIQPQDRKSVQAGDSEAAVLGRQRWIARGHMSGLVDTLRTWTAAAPTAPSTGDNRGDLDRADVPAPRTLDLGCGEGSFGRSLFLDESDGYCGIDLSKRALKLAARGWPDATWVLANADRVLPVADETVHRVVSLFGRRPAGEIHRVLVDGGCCIIAVPGENDLIELRESFQNTGRRRSRWEAVVEELTLAGLEFIEHRLWKERTELEPDAIADALAMTYRAVRHSQQTRAEALDTMKVTLAADLMMLRKPAG